MVFVDSFLTDEAHLMTHMDEDMVNDISFNLIHLFESEAPLLQLDSSLTEVNRSIMRFGIEEIQSLNYQSRKQDFINSLKSLLKIFEPRIRDVEITLLDQNDGLSLRSQTVHFVIEGELADGNEFMFNSEFNLGQLSVNMENDLD